MFAVIGAYIKNIALLMLLTIFAELLVPDAKIKKYVSVIVGAIMIFTIVGRLGDVLASIGGQEIAVPAFQTTAEDQKPTDIRERLTGILYDEMNDVENKSENNTDLDIHVERVTPYEENTDGEVVK